MQQVHDGDCGLMTADANTIDYKPLTNLAELTGGVKVVQAGRGESHSEHMIYNTDTGDMESGDNSPSSRVHMVMEPKARKPPPTHQQLRLSRHAESQRQKPAAGRPRRNH